MKQMLQTAIAPQPALRTFSPNSHSVSRPRPFGFIPSISKPTRTSTLIVQANDHSDTNGSPGIPHSSLQEAFDVTLLLRRQLTIAVDDQDFKLAARIKAELFNAISNLSEEYRQLYLHLETLRDPTATSDAKRNALYALKLYGDSAALPDVYAFAKQSNKLRREAEEAAAGIRHRSIVPGASDLCQRACGVLVKLMTASRSILREQMSIDDGDNAIDLGKKALKLYTKAIQIDAHCAAAFAGRGAVQYYLGQYESAVEDLEAALNIDPWHGTASRMLALSKGQLKQFSSARSTLQAAEVLNPLLAEDEQQSAVKQTLQRWEAESENWKERYSRVRERMAAAEEQRSYLESLLKRTPETDNADVMD